MGAEHTSGGDGLSAEEQAAFAAMEASLAAMPSMLEEEEQARRRIFSPDGEDFGVELAEIERVLLASIATSLHDGLAETGPRGPMACLFPTAYPGEKDHQREAEYRLLAGTKLVDERLESYRALLHSAGAERLDAETLLVWVRVTNDARAMLARVLGFSEGALEARPLGDGGQTEAVYHWLAYLQHEALAALGGPAL